MRRCRPFPQPAPVFLAVLCAIAVTLIGTFSGSIAGRRVNAAAATTFAIDADLVTPGVQATRPAGVPVGSNFTFDVVLTDVVPQYATYDVMLDYDDVIFDAVGLGQNQPPDWDMRPVLDTTDGTVDGTLVWPGGQFCDPTPTSNSLTDEDNTGIATIDTTCSPFNFGEVSTYKGKLVEIVLTCRAAGTGAITLHGVLDTFVSDQSFRAYNDGVTNGSVTCGSSATNTPTRTNTPTSTATRTYTPTATNTPAPATATPTPGGCNAVDPNGDPDGDGLSNQQEAQFGTNPCDNDSDDDGCTDGREKGATPTAGGQRNPLNHWDFYDVNGSRKVDSIDIGLVRMRFNLTSVDLNYGTQYDRTTGAFLWAPGAPNGKIDSIDIGLVRAEFNHSCIPPP